MSEQAPSFKDTASKENTDNDTGDLNYGYDFYPERRGGEPKKGLWRRLTGGYAAGRQLKCYANVHWCIRNSEYLNPKSASSIW